MSSVRLVVCDLDGTLVPHRGRIGRRTRETLAEVRRRGIRLAVATGRLFHHALPAAVELGLDAEPLICCDGAATRCIAGDCAERELFLSPEAAHEAFAQLFFYADDIFLLGREVIYAAPDADPKLAAAWGDRVVRYDPTDALPPEIQTLLAFGRRGLLAQAARLTVAADQGLEAVLVEGRYKGLTPLVVRPRGADKGAALADLRRRLGLERAEVMVFGDWPNDLPLFKQAGYAVAPRNAHPAVKRAASHVSAYTDEEEFVARELERLIL